MINATLKTLLLGLICLMTNGAMAQAAPDPQRFQSLVADSRAYRVGDALTVLIQESAVASSSVDAKANRNTDIDLKGQVLGHPQKGLNGSVSSSSDGGGQVVRSGRVTAQVTVTVKEILPNGELIIDGTQSVNLNGEQQIISVNGHVRLRDISDTNTVLSSRVADAHITYDGQGFMAERSHPSVISRFFNWIGL